MPNQLVYVAVIVLCCLLSFIVGKHTDRNKTPAPKHKKSWSPIKETTQKRYIIGVDFFPCPYCQYWFTHKEDLDRHVSKFCERKHIVS